jgi:DnaK suppressor protein
MNKEERKHLKEKIADLIAKSEKEIIELEENTRPISPENSIGRISRMDAINNKSVMEAALRSKKQKLGKLKLALTKVGSENFGICSECKNPIQPARLMYLPESSKCIRCADR